MRPVLLNDVTTTARALLSVRECAREAVCERIFRFAERGDHYTRNKGKVHRLWGDGTLLSAARQWPVAPEPTFDNDSYCQCIEMVLHQLRKRRQGVGM